MLSQTSFRIDSTLDEVGPLAEAVYDLAVKVLDPDGAGEVELALMEALNNVIVHGGASAPIDLHVEIWPREVRLEVVDRADPMPAGSFLAAKDTPEDALLADPFELVEGGRGIKLILACMNEVEYRSLHDGNHLRMVRRA